MATKGFGVAEVEQAYARSRELCRQMGEAPQHFPVLFGLRLFYMARAEHRTARELGEQLLDLARRAQVPALLPQAYDAMGITLSYLGELALARAHLEQGMALYDPQRHRSLAFLSGRDTGVLCRCQMAWILWALGYPDQARARSREAL